MGRKRNILLLEFSKAHPSSAMAPAHPIRGFGDRRETCLRRERRLRRAGLPSGLGMSRGRVQPPSLAHLATVTGVTRSRAAMMIVGSSVCTNKRRASATISGA